MSRLETKPLGQLLQRPPRYGINAAAVPFGPNLPTYLRITDIDEFGRYAPNPKVSVKHSGASSYRMAPGELVFARTGASVGKSYLYDSHDGELVYAGFLINVAPDSALLNPKFLSLIAQTKQFWDWICRTSVRSGQPGVNGREYATFPVPVPDITVQNAIAAAMTDVDNLIAKLERLLAKKQAIKQGMMQQLLTGATRLAGFNESWETVPLGDVARIKTGSRNNQDKNGSGRYPFFVRSATVERIDSYSYDCEAILVPGEGGIGSIFHYVNGKFEVHQRVYNISHFTEAVVGKFVYYYMQNFFGKHAMENSVKATVDSLRLPTFQAFAMMMPSSTREQQAIVELLDNASDELGLLKRRLVKAIAIKQGMMQELLTGRTRLPSEELKA